MTGMYFPREKHRFCRLMDLSVREDPRTSTAMVGVDTTAGRWGGSADHGRTGGCRTGGCLRLERAWKLVSEQLKGGAITYLGPVTIDHDDLVVDRTAADARPVLRLDQQARGD